MGSLGDLWDDIQCTNSEIVGAPEGKQSDKGTGNLFEVIMAGNFLNPVKERTIYVWKQRAPDKMSPQSPLTRRIKMPKVKDRDRTLSTTHMVS